MPPSPSTKSAATNHVFLIGSLLCDVPGSGRRLEVTRGTQREASPAAVPCQRADARSSDSASSRRTVCRLGFEGLSIRLRPLVQGDAIRGLARAKAWAEHGGAEAGIGG